MVQWESSGRQKGTALDFSLNNSRLFPRAQESMWWNHWLHTGTRSHQVHYTTLLTMLRLIISWVVLIIESFHSPRAFTVAFVVTPVENPCKAVIRAWSLLAKNSNSQFYFIRRRQLLSLSRIKQESWQIGIAEAVPGSSWPAMLPLLLIGIALSELIHTAG